MALPDRQSGHRLPAQRHDGQEEGQWGPASAGQAGGGQDSHPVEESARGHDAAEDGDPRYLVPFKASTPDRGEQREGSRRGHSSKGQGVGRGKP